LTRFFGKTIIFVIKQRSEKSTLLILKFILVQYMLIDQELNSQFILFEDDENTEIPTQEPEGDSLEDADEEDEEEEDDDTEDDQEKE